ncbi:AMP-binding enzyme family protein, partial [Vibrio parahaemolyticus EKP-028]
TGTASMGKHCGGCVCTHDGLHTVQAEDVQTRYELSEQSAGSRQTL